MKVELKSKFIQNQSLLKINVDSKNMSTQNQSWLKIKVDLKSKLTQNPSSKESMPQAPGSMSVWHTC